MRITIDLTPEEAAQIKALAIRFGAKPSEILTRFASDLTGSLRTSGSDERTHALEYVQRAFFDKIECAYSPEEGLTDEESEKMQRLHAEAWRYRETQQAAWKIEREARHKGLALAAEVR